MGIKYNDYDRGFSAGTESKFLTTSWHLPRSKMVISQVKKQQEIG